MANNFSKLWIQKTQNDLAIKRAGQAIQSTGRALPCRVVAVNGSIVTVAFEVDSATWPLPQITIPKAESQWIRTPTQVGDFGVTVPADVYLGGVSGLGGGTANFAQRGNLSALQFMPIASKNFSSVDPNAAYISGPNGAVIQTQDGTAKIVANESSITLTFGSTVVTIDGSGIHFTGAVTGNSTATFTGEGTFNGSHTVSAHTHGGVQPGGGTTAPPTG
ncbi:hypothetical protein [Dyella sp.]|uniref:hypothetical protein n=1 Tax=Dyella sp. TaxID=1869338 RepID=UPI0028492F62|nr:hypothetical protein [Dyella sp.]MDR3445986.1 hypothetical protein [Dyella sp.]